VPVRESNCVVLVCHSHEIPALLLSTLLKAIVSKKQVLYYISTLKCHFHRAAPRSMQIQLGCLCQFELVLLCKSHSWKGLLELMLVLMHV
jgi:hypothetical protein